MKKLLLTTALTSAVMILAGCVSTSTPVSIGNGQYSISSSNYWAWSGADQQAGAMKAANDFCAKQGKVARMTSMSAEDAVAYRSVASAQVTFVCEDPNQTDEPVEMAGGVYMLAGSSSGYQGIKARYQLMQKASAFCKKQGLKVQLVDTTREYGQNWTSFTGKTNTGNSAENTLQNSSADIFFRCAK